MQVTVRDAKAKLSKYGDMAHDGRKVVVCKNGSPWFDLVPHQAANRRTKPLAGVQHKISIAEAVSPLDGEDLPGWS